MSLQKILLDIASECGVSISDDTERLWAIKMVNDAAKELWETEDLVGSLRELTFNIDSDAQSSSMVSLPGYVDQLRGVKYSQVLGGKIPQNDMRPRYHFGRGWGANAFAMPVRVVRESSPLKRDIINASIITFSIPESEDNDIVITIVGETTNSSRTAEKVTIIAGSTEVSTVGNFIGDLINIEKTSTNINNITITDVDYNELGVIFNNELKPKYKWLELQDNNVLRGQSNTSPIYTSIDILYKPKFIPFVELFDEFQASDKYDRAIFYKFQELYFAQQDGKLENAILAGAKVKKLVDDMNIDSEQGRELEMEFGRSGFADAQNPYTPYKNWNRVG